MANSVVQFIILKFSLLQFIMLYVTQNLTDSDEFSIELASSFELKR